MYIQVSSLTTCSFRFSGMDRYSTARTTSPTIMVIRRSNRSATAPASGPRISAGSSEVSQTPPTARALRRGRRPASAEASAVSASRLSQSPRLDSDSAIHSLRNGLMDSTPLPPLRREGDVKFTALGYRQRCLSCGRQARRRPPHLFLSTSSRRT